MGNTADWHIDNGLSFPGFRVSFFMPANKTCREQENEIRCWHFASKTLRDGSPLPAPGHELPKIGDPIPCNLGYHASARALDALSYAPGSMVARVKLTGRTIPHGRPVDKHVAEQRIVIAGYVDADAVLRKFARRCALSVIDLWDSPAVVRQYLETGDESIRKAARAVAGAAAGDAAWAAAWAAAGAAARAAARAAAEDTAEDTAWAAAGAAARAAARAAAEDTAGAAAGDAAWAAARAAAEEAARAAARAAAKDADTRASQNTQLEAALFDLLGITAEDTL